MRHNREIDKRAITSVLGVRPHGQMRDDAIEEIKRLDALLEYAVQHGEDAEAERLREELKRLTEMI